MRGITAFGAVAALWLASATAGIAAPSLTVLCGVDEAWCAAMKTAYEAKTGLEVSMTRKSTGDILNLIRAEKSAPAVDVWWGGTGDTHLQATSSASAWMTGAVAAIAELPQIELPQATSSATRRESPSPRPIP